MCSGMAYRRDETSCAEHLGQKVQRCCLNLADAERSNSIYKLVLSNRRRSTTNQNLRALVFLYHNQRLCSGAFEREEMEDEREDMEDEGEGEDMEHDTVDPEL